MTHPIYLLIYFGALPKNHFSFMILSRSIAKKILALWMDMHKKGKATHLVEAHKKGKGKSFGQEAHTRRARGHTILSKLERNL